MRYSRLKIPCRRPVLSKCLVVNACTLGALISLNLSTLASAETLENLLESKTMQEFKLSKMERKNDKKKNAFETVWLRGIDPKSNFAAVWASSNAPSVMLNWLGAKLPYFTYRRQNAMRSSNLVRAGVELSNFDKVVCKLMIMVPHPSITPLVESNVLEEFRKLRPPALEVVGEKPVPLSGAQGMLYEHKLGGASLVVSIAQHGVITLSTNEYKNSQVLIDVAKALDIERLNRKLDS